MKKYGKWIIGFVAVSFTLIVAFLFDKSNFLQNSPPSPIKFLLGTSSLAALFLTILLLKVIESIKIKSTSELTVISSEKLGWNLILSAAITYLALVLLAFAGIYLPPKVVNVATMLLAAYSSAIFLLYSLKPLFPEKQSD